MQKSYFDFSRRNLVWWGAIFMSMIAVSCAAGDPQFSEESPAGFWQGLWHGMIAVITFFISLFSDTVKIYEANNNGGWYDFGFLMGVTVVWGGSSGKAVKLKGERRAKGGEPGAQEEWETRFYESCRDWAKEEDDQEWIEISQKVEKKLKRKLKEWAEED